MEITGGLGGAIPIAEALLEAGILVDSDWTGDLVLSIQAGMSRWADEIGAAHMEHLHFDLLFSDDLATHGFDVYMAHQMSSQLKVGGFGFRVKTYSHLLTEVKVKALEKVLPGAGFTVLQAAEKALWTFIHAATPGWAYEQIAEQADWNDVDPAEAEREGYLTLDLFERTIPRECLSQYFKFQPSLIERALSLNPKRRERETLQAARALAQWMGKRKNKAFDNYVNAFEELRPVMPLEMRWNESDQVNRVSDEFHDDLANSGFETDLVFLTCFGDEGPTPLYAAKEFKAALELAVLTDDLLRRLQTPSPRLINVLADAPRERAFV